MFVKKRTFDTIHVTICDQLYFFFQLLVLPFLSTIEIYIFLNNLLRVAQCDFVLTSQNFTFCSLMFLNTIQSALYTYFKPCLFITSRPSLFKCFGSSLEAVFAKAWVGVGFDRLMAAGCNEQTFGGEQVWSLHAQQ